MVYVGKKNGNRVRDLIVYEVDLDTGKITQTLRADSGIMTADSEASLLNIDLFDVRIEMPDPEMPEDASRTRYFSAQKYPIRLNFNQLTGEKTVAKKRKNMTARELIWRIRNTGKAYELLSPEDRARQRSQDLIELNQRICLAIAPFMFVLVAIPLGIRSHRKESSAGMLISLGIVFAYYVFIIISDTFDDMVYMRPWLIPWIPILGGQIAGLVLLRRAN
jgi:lipopolysaccharide export system permease protein